MVSFSFKSFTVCFDGFSWIFVYVFVSLLWAQIKPVKIYLNVWNVIFRENLEICVFFFLHLKRKCALNWIWALEKKIVYEMCSVCWTEEIMFYLLFSREGRPGVNEDNNDNDRFC